MLPAAFASQHVAAVAAFEPADLEIAISTIQLRTLRAVAATVAGSAAAGRSARFAQRADSSATLGDGGGDGAPPPPTTALASLRGDVLPLEIRLLSSSVSSAVSSSVSAASGRASAASAAVVPPIAPLGALPVVPPRTPAKPPTPRAVSRVIDKRERTTKWRAQLGLASLRLLLEHWPDGSPAATEAAATEAAAAATDAHHGASHGAHGGAHHARLDCGAISIHLEQLPLLRARVAVTNLKVGGAPRRLRAALLSFPPFPLSHPRLYHAAHPSPSASAQIEDCTDPHAPHLLLGEPPRPIPPKPTSEGAYRDLADEIVLEISQPDKRSARRSFESRPPPLFQARLPRWFSASLPEIAHGTASPSEHDHRTRSKPLHTTAPPSTHCRRPFTPTLFTWRGIRSRGLPSLSSCTIHTPRRPSTRPARRPNGSPRLGSSSVSSACTSPCASHPRSGAR